MSETAPFAFAPAKPKSETEPTDQTPSKPRRGSRKAASTESPAKPKRGKRQPRAVKLDVVEVVAAASILTEADSSAFVSIVKGLNQLPTASRKRIVAALGKVFR